MSGQAKRTKMSTVMLLAIAGALFFACAASSSALAAEVHVFSRSFGSGLALSSQSGIAVDEETGESYVADTEHSRIARFTAAGTADGAIAGVSSPTFVAVDNSTGPSKGDIYVLEGELRVSKFDPTGALVTSWGTGGHLTTTEEVVGIAVDAGGNLWIATQNPGQPDPSGIEFGYVGVTVTATERDQSGAVVRSWGPHSLGEPTRELIARAGIAVDSADNLYFFKGAIDEQSGAAERTNVLRISPAGQALNPPNNPGPSAGLASDLTDDDLYFGVSGVEPASISRNSPEPVAGESELERFGGEFEGPTPPFVRKAPVKDGLEGIASIAATKDGAVYVLDPKGKVAVFELEEVEPPSATIEPPSAVTQTSAHVVGHIDPNAPTGSWPSHDVAWEFVCTPACPGHNGYIEVELDGSEQTVEATIGGLEPGTEYSVYLVARNRGGAAEAPANPNPGGPNPGEPFTTAAAPPSVTDRAPTGLSGGEASLNAGVNSNGAATTFHFEYTTKAAFEAEGFGGAQTIMTPESEPLPAAAMVRPVTVRVAGLSPFTVYVYRIVAQNSLGVDQGVPVTFTSQFGPTPVDTNCTNQLLRTDVGARLPDCRAYELVSPTEKLGSPVESYLGGLQAAADGSGVTWYTGQQASGVPSPGAGHQTYAFYLSSRLGEAWSSARLLAPEEPGRRASYLVGLTGDDQYGLIETNVDGKTFAEPALYLLNTADHSLRTIVPPQVGQAVGSRVFALDGANATDSLIFFESRLQLTTKAALGKNNLYVWNRESGTLSLAGVLPGSQAEAPAGGSFGGSYLWWGANPSLDLGGAEEALYVESEHAVSESGDSVYFTAAETGQIYLRRGLTTAKPTTVRVSVANSGVSDPNGAKPAAFQQATPDGSRAFFLSAGKLTLDGNTGPSDEGSDLYRYEPSAKIPLVDVTSLPGGAGARVQGLLGVSDDGRSGYLVAEGVLAVGGVDGSSNVYHFKEEADGTFAYTFVATLGPQSGGQEERNWSPTANEPRTSRVSADGETLMFMSKRALAGASFSCTRTDCYQVYRFSATDGQLQCLSCNPTDEPSPFGAELMSEAGGVVPENRVRTKTEAGNAISGVLPANMSSSGNRVFFQTAASLLPEDRNGINAGQSCETQKTCVDVYEWEAPDAAEPTDTCRSTQEIGGCLYLLSSGESDLSSYFVNASSDGSSVFIMTSSSLVPADQDALTDVYDARINGGLVSQHASELEPCASSVACKGSGAPVPTTDAAGTSTFQGPGNVKAKQCKKGLVLKRGKCVKKAKAKHKRPKHQKKRKRNGRRAGKSNSGGGK